MKLVFLILAMVISPAAMSCAPTRSPPAATPDAPKSPPMTTRPARTWYEAHREIVAITDPLLKRDMSHASSHSEGITDRLSLVRYAILSENEMHYLLRVLVDESTGEVTELRGAYAPEEMKRIDRRRPAGVMAPEEAVAAATEAAKHLGNQTPPPDRSEIDFVASRYYVIRAPVKTSRQAGDLSPRYAYRALVDGATRRVIDIKLD